MKESTLMFAQHDGRRHFARGLSAAHAFKEPSTKCRERTDIYRLQVFIAAQTDM